jgi:predicted AAA+ superfamily ATPase
VKQRYLKRIIDKEFSLALRSSGAVLLEGSKWIGKTRTASEQAASSIYLHDTEKRNYYLEVLKTNPSLLLEGKTPRLIDEWQDAPILWDGVRFAVDQRGGQGHFILTGSAVPPRNSTMHTGTGRIARLTMRPMTLYESLESSGDVSLASLFNGDDVKGISPLELEDIAFALARGGWPGSIGMIEELALRHAYDFVNGVINSDISRVDGVSRDPTRVKRLMRSLARNTSSLAKMETILIDVAGHDFGDINSNKTVYSYMEALNRIFVIEDLPAWSPNMRSKTALRSAPKRHFVDPSIAAALLGTSPEGLMKDPNTFGQLFESMCIRDLRVYAQVMQGSVFHIRDKNGLEADAIISLRDGRWGAIEIKLGAGGIENGIRNLKKLRDKIDLDLMGEPSFMAVITASPYAHTIEDGIHVVPIGCLKD